MIDAAAFLIERERLRRFCFPQTRSAIVIRDTCSDRSSANHPQDDPVSRLAEFLQLLLMVDGRRFADPDDLCSDFGPSIFALPTSDAKRDVETILTASVHSFEAIVVDYRVSEVVYPLIAPRLLCDKMRAIKVWDRSLRQQRRICAILTLDRSTDDTAVLCDGGRLLRRADGETFDLAGQFWLQVYNDVASQRCMRREAWERSGHEARGSA